MSVVEEMTETLTVAEAAARAGVAISTVLNAIAKGRLIGTRPGRGRSTEIDPAELDAWRQRVDTGSAAAPDGMLAIVDAATAAGVSMATIEKALASGVLTRHRVGRRVFVDAGELMAWRDAPRCPYSAIQGSADTPVTPGRQAGSGRPPSLPGLLCTAEAAAAAGVSSYSVEAAVRDGSLPVHRVGRFKYFKLEDLQACFPHSDEMTVRTAAGAAGVPENALYTALRRGELACRRLRAATYVTLDTVTAWAATYVTPTQREAERLAKREQEAEAAGDHIGGAADLAAAWERTEPTILDAIASIDAARLAGISWLTMRRAISRGDFDSELVDGQRVVSRADLIAWAKAKKLILGDRPL